MSVVPSGLSARVGPPLRLISTWGLQKPDRHTSRPLHSRSCDGDGLGVRSRRPDAPVAQSPQHRKTHQRLFHSSNTLEATKDPYRVLGLGKDASTADIKKAYYGMAKKYHPDTNKEATAKEKFGDAQSAYDLLTDPKKKQAWDQFGAAAFDQAGGFDPSGGAGAGGPFGAGGNPFGGGFAGGFGAQGGFGGQGGFGAEFSFEDLFSAFTGGRRARGGGRQYQEEILVGENIEVQTNISFMDAAKGVAKDIFITPLVQCKTCSGNGLKKGKSRETCKKCDGTGTRIHNLHGMQMASTCDSCGGQGIKTPRGSECGTCSGNGVTREKRTVNVDIPGGVEDGMRLRVNQEGDYPPTGQAANPSARTQKGDLYVFIRVAPDKNFSRNGADILYTASIPITTAVLGGEIRIPTLDGEVKVKVATGTGTGDRVTMSGMGMARLGARRSSKGDLKVEFKVQMPKFLSANQRAIMEMMAEDLGDKSAKRVMSVNQTSTDTSSTNAENAKPQEDSHQNEGFFKRMWHDLSGQHDQKPDSNEGGGEDSSKKSASGSG